MEITKPCVVPDMPEDVYHADPCPAPSLSASCAKKLVADTPWHAWNEHPHNPNRAKQQDEHHFDIGHAAHALLLEGEDRIAVIDAADWRTKAAKEERDAARANGHIPLLKNEADDIYRMRDAAMKAIRENEHLSGMTLADGKSEQSFFWQDSTTGIWKRSRLDWLSNGAEIILDYKSTSRGVNPYGLGKLIVSCGYDIQGATYIQAVNTLVPGSWPQFVLMFQETEPPYSVVFAGVGGELLGLGEQKLAYATNTWAECLRTGEFPGYPKRTMWPQCPAWASAQWVDKTITEEID